MSFTLIKSLAVNDTFVNLVCKTKISASIKLPLDQIVILS